MYITKVAYTTSVSINYASALLNQWAKEYQKKKSLFALQAVFSIISFFIKNLNKSNTSFASLCIWKSSGYCMIILHIDSYQWIINTKHLKLSTREKISMTKFLFPKMCCSVFWELQRFLSFHFLWIEKSRCPL